MKQNIENNNIRWRYRRRLTFSLLVLYYLVVFYGLFYINVNTDVYGSILTSITSIVIAVVGSYIGFSTYDDVKILGKKRDSAMKPDEPEGGVG